MPVEAIVPLLLIAHCLLDYPLQGDFLSKAKNHSAPIPGVPWQWALFAHSCIQGGGVFGVVWWVTGSFYAGLALGLLEAGAHAVIDWMKSNNDIDFTTDQLAHLSCKSAWASAVFVYVGSQ